MDLADCGAVGVWDVILALDDSHGRSSTRPACGNPGDGALLNSSRVEFAVRNRRVGAAGGRSRNGAARYVAGDDLAFPGSRFLVDCRAKLRCVTGGASAAAIAQDHVDRGVGRVRDRGYLQLAAVRFRVRSEHATRVHYAVARSGWGFCVVGASGGDDHRGPPGSVAHPMETAGTGHCCYGLEKSPSPGGLMGSALR